MSAGLVCLVMQSWNDSEAQCAHSCVRAVEPLNPLKTGASHTGSHPQIGTARYTETELPHVSAACECRADWGDEPLFKGTGPNHVLQINAGRVHADETSV